MDLCYVSVIPVSSCHFKVVLSLVKTSVVLKSLQLVFSRLVIAWSPLKISNHWESCFLFLAKLSTFVYISLTPPCWMSSDGIWPLLVCFWRLLCSFCLMKCPQTCHQFCGWCCGELRSVYEFIKKTLMYNCITVLQETKEELGSVYIHLILDNIL